MQHEEYEWECVAKTESGLAIKLSLLREPKGEYLVRVRKAFDTMVEEIARS